MSTTMLDYSKMILEKVSFDAALFRKELEKAVKWLIEPEATELRNWANNKYSNNLIPVSVSRTKRP